MFGFGKWTWSSDVGPTWPYLLFLVKISQQWPFSWLETRLIIGKKVKWESFNITFYHSSLSRVRVPVSKARFFVRLKEYLCSFSGLFDICCSFHGRYGTHFLFLSSLNHSHQSFTPKSLSSSRSWCWRWPSCCSTWGASSRVRAAVLQRKVTLKK